MTDVFSLLINNKVKLDSAFTNVILAVMVLEGTGRTLDRDIDILKMAIPVLLFM